MKKEIAAFITAGLLVSGGYGAAAQNETEQAAGVQHGMGYISVVDAAKPEIGSYNAWGTDRSIKKLTREPFLLLKTCKRCRRLRNLF